MKKVLNYLCLASVFLIPVVGYILSSKVDEPETKKDKIIVIVIQSIGSALALEQLGTIFGV